MSMYDELQKERERLKRKDRIMMDWMVLLAIFFTLIILYLPIPQLSATSRWSEEKTNFIEMKRFKPPPPPKEEKVEEKKIKKKKKVLAKPIPEVEVDENEPVTIDEEDVEIVYDVDDIDMDEPEELPSGPLRVGGDVVPAKIIKRVQPVYPEIARKAKIQGIVILEAVITKEGKIGEVKVLKSLNSFCDKAAIEAVKQWEFTPGTQNDIPVDVIMTLTVIFKIQ